MAIVNAVNRAIKILKLLTTENELTLTEISDILDIPKSSAYDILQTLTAEGMVAVKDEYRKVYSLGLASFEIGSAYIARINVHFIAHTYLEELMKKHHTTSFLAIPDLEKGMIVYIEKVEPADINRATVKLGTRKGMYHNSLGKALLASYSEQQLQSIIEQSMLIPKTSRTIINYEALIDNLNLTRKRGYAVDNREDNDNIFCIGSPVFNNKGIAVAAISLSFLYFDIKDRDIEQIGQDVKNTALQISKQLGYTKDTLF